MLPETLPHWLDYASSENTAAAMFRGLQGLSARWGELWLDPINEIEETLNLRM